MATERVTLYGLPIVAGRTVAYGRIDPVLSRELFIRRALVERDWETRHEFFAENGRLLEEAEELEHRARRRDIVVGDEARFDFFDARIPADVVSGGHFDRWWRDERRADPTCSPTRATCSSTPAAAVDARACPPAWQQGDLTAAAQLPLRARRARTTASPSTCRSPRSAHCAPAASTGSCPACGSSSSPR